MSAGGSGEGAGSKDGGNASAEENAASSTSEQSSLVDDVPEFKPAPRGERADIEDISPRVKERNWDPDEHAQKVQAKLAFRLIWVLSGVLLGGAAVLCTTRWTDLKTADVTNFFAVAFGAIVTLATAATSFWFGSQKGRSGPRQ